MESPVRVGMNGLYPRRIIDMSYGRDFRSRDIEALDAEQLVVARIGRAAALVQHVSDNLHIRAVSVEIEPVGHVLAQHSRSERAEAFAKLDPEIERALHGRGPRI